MQLQELIEQVDDLRRKEKDLTEALKKLRGRTKLVDVEKDERYPVIILHNELVRVQEKLKEMLSDIYVKPSEVRGASCDC